MAESKTYSEEEVQKRLQEMAAYVEFRTAGNSVMIKCLAYVEDEFGRKYISKMEREAFVQIYNQWMAPPQPVAAPEPEPEKDAADE